MSGITIDNIRLPAEVERGMRGGPSFFTTVLPGPNGVKTTVQNWPQALCRYELSLVGIKRDVLEAFTTFVLGRRGAAYGFLFKDWRDYSATAQPLGTGDGVDTTFPLIRTYADAVRPYLRQITRPVLTGTGALVIYANAVAVSDTLWDFANGVVTFAPAPANGVVLTWTGNFEIPVSFVEDQIPVTLAHENMATLPSFVIEEINEWAQLS